MAAAFPVAGVGRLAGRLSDIACQRFLGRRRWPSDRWRLMPCRRFFWHLATCRNVTLLVEAQKGTRLRRFGFAVSEAPTRSPKYRLGVVTFAR